VDASAPDRSAASRNCKPRVPISSSKAYAGNVDTRLRKLDEGQFDSIVLAAAG
jgi:porphobilinogen deaminase